MVKLISLNFLWMIVFVSCSNPNSPKGVLNQFIATYLQEANPRAALSVTTGLAEEKLREEIKQIQGMEAERRENLPKIRVTILKEQAETDTVDFIISVNVEAAKEMSFSRELAISAKNIQGQWKIINFDFLK